MSIDHCSVPIYKVYVTHVIAAADGDLKPGFHTYGMKVVLIKICFCVELVNMASRHWNDLVCNSCKPVVMRVLFELCETNTPLYLVNVRLYVFACVEMALKI